MTRGLPAVVTRPKVPDVTARNCTRRPSAIAMLFTRPRSAWSAVTARRRPPCWCELPSQRGSQVANWSNLQHSQRRGRAEISPPPKTPDAMLILCRARSVKCSRPAFPFSRSAGYHRHMRIAVVSDIHGLRGLPRVSASMRRSLRTVTSTVVSSDLSATNVRTETNYNDKVIEKLCTLRRRIDVTSI